jgi:tetratricopeptide (TPR) repeat protein
VGAATFEEQRKAASASLATQPEAAILSLLKAGLDEGKAMPAVADAQKWLRNNQPNEPLLLYYAGRAAELSGDWKGAAALYQQYLVTADVSSPTADEAVYATYVLLIERLKDDNSAYAFGKNEGGRLLRCPRAKQFDTWFLEEAVKRTDATAVAQRLKACISVGLPADLLHARYSIYFRWLLSVVDGYCDAPNSVPVTQDFYDAVKDLCEIMTHDEEMKLRLDWAVSIKAYNVAKIGDKGKKQVAKRPPGKKRSEQNAAVAQKVEEKKLEMGDVSVPPTAEAAALLGKFPCYALWVMTGWAGGGNGQHYRGDPKKYWPHEAEAKMAPILAALKKVAPTEAAEILNTIAYNNYVNTPSILELKSVQEFLKANAAVQNSRNGVMILGKEWNKLTLEEAQKLAPQLAQFSNPQASLVRAIATGGKDFDKVLGAFLGPEVWRLGPSELNGGYADQLWHYCGRPGGNQKRDDGVAKAKAVAATLASGSDAKKEDSADKRIAAFNKLWADYKSPQPTIPAVHARLTAVLKITPELVPQLLKDPNPEAQTLVRDALAAGMEDANGFVERDQRIRGISLTVYSPWILRLATACYGGMERLKREKKDLYLPHPLEPVLRAAITERLQQGKIEPWLTLAWINIQFPENNAEQVKMMQALFKSPAWVSVPFEVQFAAREWFKKDAMTPGQFAWLDAAELKAAFKELLALPKEADATVVAAALQAAIAGAKKSPIRIEIQGMDQLGSVSNTVFADPNVVERVLEIADGLRDPCRNPRVGNLLLAVVKEKRDPVMLHRAANFVWSFPYYGERRNPFSAVRQLAESFLDENPAMANAMARIGLNYFNGLGGDWAFNPVTDIPALKTLQVKSSTKLGLMDIPVAQTHVAYPIYKSQAEWQGGNEDSAWTLCQASWEQLLLVHRDLTVDYLMWVLRRTLYSRDDARQEALIKALLAWTTEPNTPLVPQQKAEIEIAYGDIAVQRGMLKQAHELFTRTLQNKAYEGTSARSEAALRRVLVERMSKEFDAALQTLQDLEMERVPEMWSPLRYARAEVYYDMEDYDRAATDIDSILIRVPDHSEAKIMQGNLQIKRQKLMEATEIELGPVSSQKAFVPGEKLKVTLSDPTLAISGAGTEIEVVVEATSGDKERFFLRQFGDQKTKFRGEVATALGKPIPDDRILQVLGDDKVYYAYSERFRKKMNNMEEKRGGPISVASDGLLMASARKLLSEAEQRVADMEEQMAELHKTMGSSSAARAGAEAKLAATVVAESQAGENPDSLEIRTNEALQKRILSERIKPGNPLYIRVIDADRSRTAGKDAVTVSVETSSGDAIGQVTLQETDTHTGWFEGSVPTAGAQAKAFAQNTAPGRNPNMVISPLSNYPAWSPVATKDIVPEFVVDLNDNLALGELTITAREQGSKLKKFVVQTGMNAKELTTVAVYPLDQLSVADPNRPSIVVMNDTDRYHASIGRSVTELKEMREHLERGWMNQQFAQGLAQNVTGPSAALPASIPTALAWKRNGQHDVSSVIYRFQGLFYEPEAVMRRFRLELGKFEIPKNTHPSINHPPQFMLAVDGVPLAADGKLEGEVQLRPGLHRFEIWATGWVKNIGFGRTVKVLANVETSDTLSECPDRFFDPASFPVGVLEKRNGAATVKANAEGTTFQVAFAPGSRARLLKLVFIGQEGPVPVVNKLALTQPDGKRVLPVSEDFAVLNKNNTLEILTGDKVAVRYVDDRFVTKAKEKHERFLDVAFTTARIAFEFFELRKDRNENDEAYYEKLLRFAVGKPVLLTMTDADMDSSAKPDTVTITLESKRGGKRQVVAQETGDSTGLFRVWVTAVAGAPANASEIQVGEGEMLTAIYRDMENTEPGVPTDRYATLQQATFAMPELLLSQATVHAINPAQLPPSRNLNEGFALYFEQLEGVSEKSFYERLHAQAQSGGIIRPRWMLSNEMVRVSTSPAKGFEAVLGQTLYIEVNAAFLALRAGSQVKVYAQTEAGRKLASQRPRVAGTTNAPLFDTEVPGTMQLTGELQLSWEPPKDLWRETPRIPIYVESMLRQKTQQKTERFFCSVPLIPGVLPEHGVLTDEERLALTKAHQYIRPAGLVVQPGERVYLGFAYTDPTGAEQWLTATTKVMTHPVLDVMDSDYRTAITEAYVGETLRLRVVDLGADVSDRSDTVNVLLQAKSGAKHLVQLNEVDTHSGVFKGGCLLSYVTTVTTAATETVAFDVKQDGFPVVYGDKLGARYTDATGFKTEPVMLTISKGADGAVAAFSKKFEDPEIAMRTQFTLAESYLEVAKHHRTLKEHDSAAREYELAKQMLASAMDQFKDKATRAHAEYLLGNLTLEEADATEEKELKVDRYRAALSLFMHVTGTYSETLHASKAQFKIATIYEKLKEPEVAAQEYVKLAYKYPDSEFLATAMARLGVHFQRSAADYEARAKPLLAKTEEKDAQFDGAALQKMAVNEYLKAANIFSRLQERFPDHELAGKGGLYAGQAYLRAGQNRQALTAFQRVIGTESYDGPEIRAQAMYWAGMCYESLKEPMAAYSLYKRLTFDFPESKWASYARAQLSQEGLLRLENNLETKRLEEGR